MKQFKRQIIKYVLELASDAMKKVIINDRLIEALTPNRQDQNITLQMLIPMLAKNALT